MKTWITEGHEVYISHEEAAKSLVCKLIELGIESEITFVSNSGSAYGFAKLGKAKQSFRLSGHDVRSMNPDNHNGPKMADYNILKNTWMGFTPAYIESQAKDILDDLNYINQ